ncbi:MAG: SGNH/GDSL hydrolase family protein [Clostridia bacterium]|nr:SGNH/GDSL hydrolase family protein [Clostridia bacterium]
MKDLQENIVPAINQNSGSFYPQGGGNGVKVLFVGNSITKHAPKPSIGWNRDCGMAASSIDNDYVHITAAKIKAIDPEMSFAILQVAGFEREFQTKDIYTDYKPAIDYKADIIIMFFGANVSKEYDKIENPEIRFGDKYKELRNALNSHGTAKVYHSEGFYLRTVLNAEKKAVAESLGDTYIELGDIKTREDTHGQFNHPSDKGMEEIADLFFNTIEPDLIKLTK